MVRLHLSDPRRPDVSTLYNPLPKQLGSVLAYPVLGSLSSARRGRVAPAATASGRKQHIAHCSPLSLTSFFAQF